MENKTGKYIKYAIGEIVLVVIGILIALQINTWNQQRIQNKDEQLALKNLKQDFEYNYKALDSVLNETKNNIASQFILLNHTGNKSKDITRAQFNISLNRLADINEFYPRNGFLDDLMNSGNLGIIKNQMLRNKLSSWSSVFEYIRSREIELEKGRDRVSNMIIKKGSWLNADAVSTDQAVKNNTFPKSGFDIDNRNLLNDLEFENNTENTIYQNDKLVQSHEKGLQLITEILSLLEKEIKE
ncbi:DUF6090 family protein [Urechidicola vernalis]|uniref:DUF6090 family protein n=1 Tax=Urechidicola vernalis TaxID=3075600 RepID=A0ABU2Y7C5_9FLAO|nr:DUF6090 family protein [Urechidicola sp. P050]MDT0554103.1 DUF6090 family protein [Urechidicola sp. P050]